MMAYNEWKKLEKAEYDFLDTKDLLNTIKENGDKSVSEIMGIFEDMYEDEYLEQNKEDECLFNVITSGEFASYIRKRYGITSWAELCLFFNV